MPRLRHRLRRPAAPRGHAWSTTLDDPTVGRVALSGWLHLPPAAREAVVLVHGMGGSAESDYVRVAASAAARAGIASLRLNLRGSDLRGEDYHHAGLVEDLLATFASPALAPFERLYLLGFSLGGHLALRLAASAPPARLAAVAAVCPPLDLRSAAEVMDGRRSARPYRAYLLAALKAIYFAVAARHEVPTPVARVARVRGIQEWDEWVVAPRFGFDGALDYYARMSVGPLLSRIAVPTLVVSAMHDPMVPTECVAPWVAKASGALTVRWVEDGGHLGFPTRIDLGLGLAGGGASFEGQVLTWLRRN